MANIFDYMEWRGDLDLTQDPFNEVDSLILSTISYIDFELIEADLKTEKATIREAGEQFNRLHADEKIKAGRLVPDSIFRLLGKNGYRWVTNAANRVEWHGSGHIVGTITDITPYVDLREKLEQHQRKIGVPQCQLPRKGELFCFCRSAPESDQPGGAFQAVPRSKKAAAQKVQRLCGVSHHSQRSEMIHQIPGRLIRPSRCSNTISMVFSFQTVRFSRTDPSAKTEAA